MTSGGQVVVFTFKIRSRRLLNLGRTLTPNGDSWNSYFQQVTTSERLLTDVRIPASQLDVTSILMTGLFCLLSVNCSRKITHFSSAVQDICNWSLPKEPLKHLHMVSCVFALLLLLEISQPQRRPQTVNFHRFYWATWCNWQMSLCGRHRYSYFWL